jgi:hypothetical protein
VSKRLFFIFLFIVAIRCKSFAQVIAAPFIYCIGDSSSNGDITLYWENPPNNACGAFVQYNIFIAPEVPGTTLPGTFTQVATVTNQAQTSYILSNNNYPNTGTWFFYIQCDYNCPGATVLSSDTVNNRGPATPAIISVTVTANNQAVITFAPSTSPQTSHYILYYYLPNGTAIAFDTVYGINNTIVVDQDTNARHNPSLFSDVFTVAAIDSCGNRSSFNTAPQNTILATASNTECQRQVNISWNKYLNWPKGVLQYEIWISQNGGPLTEVGTVDSSIFTYPYSNFNTGDSLQIFIRALSAADTTIVSNSNVIHLKAVIVQPPAYVYLTNLTVTASNDISITWTVDTIAQLIYYELLQSVDSVDYFPTEQIPAPTPLQHFQTYLDTTNIYPQNNAYYYQIDAYDSCQNQYPTPFGKTICLIGTLYDYYVAKLAWNDFILSNATVAYYNLYRDFGTGSFQLLKTFQPGTNQFFDSLQAFINEKGTFCYRIDAVYYLNLPAPSGYHDSLVSSSNITCVISRPVIYVPNAFAPGGGVAENMTFKPTIIYGAPSNYTLLIYNRWGGKVFESNNPDIGWDGTDHGKAAEMGGYAYLIDFTAADGTPIERKGMVLLVR